MPKDHGLTGFDLFWSVYPKRVAKADARKAWAKLNPSEELIQKIVKALSWQARQEQWQRDNGQFAPYPGTYIRGERWDDEPQMNRPAPPPRQQLAPCADCDKEGVYPLGDRRYCAAHYMARRPPRAAA